MHRAALYSGYLQGGMQSIKLYMHSADGGAR